MVKEIRFKQGIAGSCNSNITLLNQQFTSAFLLEPYLINVSLKTSNNTLGLKSDLTNKGLFSFTAPPNFIKGPEIGTLLFLFPVYYKLADADYYIFNDPSFSCKFGIGDERDNALFASGYGATIV